MAGLCEDKIRRGAPPRAPVRWAGTEEAPGCGWVWTARSTGLPWAAACAALGAGRPGLSISAPGDPGAAGSMAFPLQGTPGLHPCREEGNEKGERDRDKGNEEKPGRKRQRGIPGQKTNTGERGR